MMAVLMLNKPGRGKLLSLFFITKSTGAYTGKRKPRPPFPPHCNVMLTPGTSMGPAELTDFIVTPRT